MSKTAIFWEVIGYITLALLVIGQIAIGYWYIPAQCCYLFANVACMVRGFKIRLPLADNIKNVTFVAITIACIMIWLI